jgi:hypothetical protein
VTFRVPSSPTDSAQLTLSGIAQARRTFAWNVYVPRFFATYLLIVPIAFVRTESLRVLCTQKPAEEVRGSWVFHFPSHGRGHWFNPSITHHNI